MTHTINLIGNVPLYGQESCVWCGAASGQMIMDGYPNSADRIFFPQVNVWNTIQANNSTLPADAGWATDPIGLRETLRLMNPPPGGTWNVHSKTSRAEILFDMLYWMNQNNYPVATLINDGDHWVVVIGYETDVEPVYGSTPTLQNITYHDPEPHWVGTTRFRSAAYWDNHEWKGPVKYAGSWLNDYVAIIEPPEKRGQIIVKEVDLIGEKIISPEEAVRYASIAIRELALNKKEPYTILNKKDFKRAAPMLVRVEFSPEMEKEERVPYYYIVPYGFKWETGMCRTKLFRLGIIVNAYNGQFEEIGIFHKPVSYLPKEEAISIVTKALNIPLSTALREADAYLMYRPSDITHNQLYPFWRIILKEKTLYVDQIGTLYNKIKPSVPGD